MSYFVKSVVLCRNDLVIHQINVHLRIDLVPVKSITECSLQRHEVFHGILSTHETMSNETVQVPTTRTRVQAPRVSEDKIKFSCCAAPSDTCRNGRLGALEKTDEKKRELRSWLHDHRCPSTQNEKNWSGPVPQTF